MYPALLNTASTRPNAALACANAALMAARFVTSSWTSWSCEGGYFAERSARAEGVRRVATTFSPAWRSWVTVSRPKPAEDPVTIVVDKSSSAVVNGCESAVIQAVSRWWGVVGGRRHRRVSLICIYAAPVPVVRPQVLLSKTSRWKEGEGLQPDGGIYQPEGRCRGCRFWTYTWDVDLPTINISNYRIYCSALGTDASSLSVAIQDVLFHL
ncbi:hypothetical protein C8Q78DRAFT_285782 [Trametes maxima]|nr:hypothetical protein C8Q78DRAFT_285782 [Trametes maxima]